jgi:hypothetical protein
MSGAMSFNLDELTHRYVTRSELDGLRQDMRADFNRLNDSVAKLVDQLARTSVIQEKMVGTLEATNHRFETMYEELVLLRNVVREIERERIEYNARWKFVFGFKSIYGGIFKILIMIIGFSLVSEGTSDFFRWGKISVKQALGL